MKVNSGLINQTYIVEHLYNGIKSKFVLQRLSNIFESHEIVNFNHKLITDHINKRINGISFEPDFKRWEAPNLIRCQSNKHFLYPFESNFWRAMVYIDESFSVDFLEDKAMAFQTGIGLSKFHLMCSDLDHSKFENSIKNFHNTKHYIDQYHIRINDYDFIKLDYYTNKRIKRLINLLSNHIKYIDLLLRSLSKISIHKNIIHGDPKLSNFLFDIKHKSVVSMIDLDTISSGYLLTDLADCLRSICNLAGEETKNQEDVSFDINVLKSFLNGYFSKTIHNKNYPFKFLPEFIYLTIFELTIRFLTDFLQSNRHFIIKYETHNLFRAEIQYRLLSSFLIQIHDFTDYLNKIGISSNKSFVSDVQKLV